MEKQIEIIMNELFNNDEVLREDLDILSDKEEKNLKNLTERKLKRAIAKIKEELEKDVEMGIKCWNCKQNYDKNKITDYDVLEISYLEVVRAVTIKGEKEVKGMGKVMELVFDLINGLNVTVYTDKEFTIKDFTI